MKRIFLFGFALMIAVGLWGCGKDSGQVQVLDRNGAVMVTLDRQTVDDVSSYPAEHRAYLEFVMSEVRSVISEKEGCAREAVSGLLLKDNCRIHTAYDPAVGESLVAAYGQYNQNGLEFAGAVTDLQGWLVAAYSGTGTEAYINFAVAPTPPYSSFKPLSVYAPALAAGQIRYSSVLLDSPVKQLEENGVFTDWPANASGSYSHQKVTVEQAVKQSLNTVAVRCMEVLGLSNSFAFLQESFDLQLKFEQEYAAAYGEQEIYGNVALGYLNEGVSPVAMAGYYQIFGNGGLYAQPMTVTRILSKDAVVYTGEPVLSQVLEPECAYIMNQLLQQVTIPGGTGQAAGGCGFPVAGKTGTGSKGNWFVGVTPEYSCAIWHGKQLEYNRAAEIFSAAVSGFAGQGGEFPQCQTVEKGIYCTQTGLLAGEGCTDFALGYYCAGDLPEGCTVHNQKN